jgi:hypothetical protein
VGLVDEVAERALQFQSFGGAGAGGRAEKLKLGKQKAEIARRRARRSAAPSCLPIFLFLAPCFLNAPGFRFPLSARRFQVSGFSLSAFQLFASWPVEQRALGLLLAGGEFDQAPNEMGSNGRPGLFQL